MTKHLSMAAAVLAAVAATTLSGCASAEPGGTTVIVTAQVEGQPALVSGDMAPYLDGLAAPGDRVVVIMADGAPHAVFDERLGDLPENELDRQDAIDEFRQRIIAAAMTAEPLNDETDITESVSLAADVLAAAPGKRRLVVISSGLQTTGALDMRDGRLESDPQVLVDQAATASPLPSLAGADVSMPRLGLTVAPQPPLPQSYVDRLEAIWTAWFTKSGAATIQTSPASLALPTRTIEHEHHVTPVSVDRIELPCIAAVDEASVGFMPGTAEYRDPVAARVALERVAASLAQCPGDWLAEGSVAGGPDTEAAKLALGAARAAAVASTLAQLAGLPTGSVRTYSWGDQWPCRTDDASGDESARMANRVVIVSRGSEPGICG